MSSVTASFHLNEMTHAEQECPVSHQEDEERKALVLGLVMSYLPIPSLGKSAQVCHTWRRLLTDGLIWASAFESAFHGSVAPVRARAACRRCVLALRNCRLMPVSGEFCGERSSPLALPRAGAAAAVVNAAESPSCPLHLLVLGGATTSFRMLASIDLLSVPHGRPHTTRRLASGVVPFVQPWPAPTDGDASYLHPEVAWPTRSSLRLTLTLSVQSGPTLTGCLAAPLALHGHDDAPPHFNPRLRRHGRGPPAR